MKPRWIQRGGGWRRLWWVAGEAMASSRISRPRAGSLEVLLAVLVLVPLAVPGQTIALRMKAINPSTTATQAVPVEAYLPLPAQASDVIDAGGFEVSYDVSKGQYQVRRTIELPPGTNVSFNVTLRDVWVIPEASLTELQTHSGTLVEKLQGAKQEYVDTANKLRETVATQLKEIRDRQAANRIEQGARPMDHIRTWESNMEALERVRKDIGMMENLVFNAGREPGVLMGSARIQFLRPYQETTATEGASGAVIRITIDNPALTNRHEFPVYQELPPEIRPEDVLQAEGLKVGFDSSRGICYVAGKIELPPKQKQVLEVRVRNRWPISRERWEGLESRASNLLAIAESMKQYVSVNASAQSIVKDLAEARARVPPDALNQDYVAFHRQQDRTLKTIEGRILRLEELFRPQEVQPRLPEVPLTNVPRPSIRTTWAIIYIILGFLFVFSLLFFLRWYGKSKAEGLTSAAAGSPEGNAGPAAGSKGPDTKG